MATMTTESCTPFRTAFRCVQGMMRSGTPFERVEQFIESQPGLDGEERAVLWLLGWAGGEPSELAALLGRGGVDAVIVVREV